jgi:hypothetical protein
MERRKFPRFHIKEHAFVVLDDQEIKLGEIVDIGPDGMSVRYLVEEEGQARDTRQIDIMMGADNFYLDKVPVITVVDRVEEALPLATTVTRIAALRFGDLTSEQKFSLASFISRNGSPITS